MKLKINMWTGIIDIVNCILFCASWFVIFGTAFTDATTGSNSTDIAAIVFYGMAWIGVIMNILALLKSKEAGISLVGPILGIIGSALFGITALAAFPALVVLIIATVFTFLERPAKKPVENA